MKRTIFETKNPDETTHKMIVFEFCKYKPNLQLQKNKFFTVVVELSFLTILTTRLEDLRRSKFLFVFE